MGMEERGWVRGHKTVDSVGSSAGSDPLRKASLQVFGPRNEYESEEARWREAEKGKGWVKRAFDETVVVQSRALVVWQDRTVFFAVFWGGAGAAALTVVSLFVPSAMLF